MRPVKTVRTQLELFAQLIIKGQSRIIETTGKDPDFVHLPMKVLSGMGSTKFR